MHGILAGWPQQLQNGQVESAQHDGESADVAEPVGQPG